MVSGGSLTWPALPGNAALSRSDGLAAIPAGTIFDVTGRNVGADPSVCPVVGFGESRKSLTTDLRWYTPGTHQITFDGSNLPSGIYVYRLQAGDLTASGKMILMK